MNVLTEKTVITKKPHVCFGCGRTFPKGTTMQFESVADCGTVYNDYFCMTCQEIRQNMKWWDEFSFGELRQDAIEMEMDEVDK